MRVRLDRLKRDLDDPAREFWPEVAKAYLRAEWPYGLSTAKLAADITARFGGGTRIWTKNAIVGQSHRMGLPRRPHAIKRHPDLVSDPTLVVLTDLTVLVDNTVDPGYIWQPVENVVVEPTLIIPVIASPTALFEPPPLAPLRLRPTAEIIPFMGRPKTCQFPYGTPREADFRFCGDPTAGPLVYCAVHAKLCYLQRGQLQRDHEAASNA